MIRNMRWRFIGAAMAAMAAVVLVLLCVINLLNYRNITRQQDETLRLLWEMEQNGPAPPRQDPRAPGGFERFSPEFQYMTRFFVVYMDENGQVLRVDQDNIASVSREEAIEYAGRALRSGAGSGYRGDYRYLVVSTGEGSAAIFLNSERELSVIRSLLVTTVLVAAVSLLVVFLLIAALSRRAVAPYVRNIETQKRFITDAGHELKTPLTAISTSADVLAMEAGENEWVKTIQLQSARMAKLIADLIALSRLDEARPLPNKAEFSLTDAVWELSESFAAAAEAGRKEYVQHIEDGVRLFGDKDAIQQLVSILLDNAVKYTEPGGKIRLDVTRRRRRVEISVYNTCRIQDRENIGRIFERFYRLEASRGSPGGYGIGLSIAKAIVENHGGSISAECQGGNSLLIRARL